jgi:hypothetical protein
VTLALTQSLFRDRDLVEGAEVRFRATCGLGWVLLGQLPALRARTRTSGSRHWSYWVDFLDRNVIGSYNATTREATTWPADLIRTLAHLQELPEVRPLTNIVEFLQILGKDLPGTEAVDPRSQLHHFNSRGFQLARQMIQDPLWSTPMVRERWTLTAPLPWSFEESTMGNFQPVTANTQDRLELRVNARSYDQQTALLFYLTLEYQMMHEYISHVLPKWNSGNTLEECYLLAVMRLFYRSDRAHGDGIVAYLVRHADERRNDAHRARRLEIEDVLAPELGEANLSKRLLELAVLSEDELAASEKRRFLANLDQLPVADPQASSLIRQSFEQDDVRTVHAKLSHIFP